LSLLALGNSIRAFLEGRALFEKLDSGDPISEFRQENKKARLSLKAGLATLK